MRRRELLAMPFAAALGRAQAGSLEELASAQKIPGIAAVVVRGGEEVYSKTLGEAVPSTRFRVGSVSKLITAAAAARLFEKGKLDLDAPVQKYVPSFPDKGAAISSRQLLGHLGGIRHYAGSEFISRVHYGTVRESLAVFQDSPLVAPPGTKFAYSSYGYNLLGAVIEGASKSGFVECVQQQVLDPLKLSSVTVDDPRREIRERSKFYSLSNGAVVEAPTVDLTDRLPSGGFLSTAQDLAHFAAAHLTDGFLAETTRTLMFTSQKTAEGKETGTGFAWRIATIDGERVYHHGGDAMGGRAMVLLRPSKGIAVAVACNLSFARIAENEAMALSQRFVG